MGNAEPTLKIQPMRDEMMPKNLQNEHINNVARGLTFQAEDKEEEEKKPERNRATVDSSENVCLFCNQTQNYNRNTDIEYICWSCVQLLSDSDQDDLKRGHKLATDKGYGRKARALDSFTIPEGCHEQRKPKSKSGFNFNRKRSFRSIRNKKDRVRLATA